jgi:hypothetical protein
MNPLGLERRRLSRRDLASTPAMNSLVNIIVSLLPVGDFVVAAYFHL